MKQLTNSPSLTGVGPIPLVKYFTCKGCNCQLEMTFQLRTEGFCYLCDPDITLEECLSEKPINNNKFSN